MSKQTEPPATPPRAPLDDESNISIFTAGKTEGPSNDPESYAKRFVHHRASSVKEEVAGDVALTEGITNFRDDKERLKQLLHALVAKKAISRDEADLALDGKSTISMLAKIGQHADVVLHEKILPFLQPGYSVLYQLVLLYEDLEAENVHD
jgi:hypothetical protein